MSDLTTRIVDEHRVYLDESSHLLKCPACPDWQVYGYSWMLPTQSHYHIAAVTEAAVREQVARDIEELIEDPILYAEDAAFVVAARIARGGAA